MSTIRYHIYQCEQQDCSFRFPAPDGITYSGRCPYCGAGVKTVATMDLSREHEQRAVKPENIHIEAILDNIRSAWNVGSMFRTADGLGVRCLHLCGISPTPAHPQVAKTALGADQAVSWTYSKNGVAVARTRKDEGFRLWGLEDMPGADLLKCIRNDIYGPPIVLVVGNEVSGVDPGILELCDRVLSIPMQGVKRSLNVAVAFGIATSFLRFSLSEMM